jgi:hypothetical protein
MLGYPKLKTDNNLLRLSLLIMLYLSYLLVLLTDYVKDSHHYQSISNQFLVATLVLIGVNLASIAYDAFKMIRIRHEKYKKAKRHHKL